MRLFSRYLITAIVLGLLSQFALSCQPTSCPNDYFRDADGFCSFCRPGEGYDSDLRTCYPCPTIVNAMCVYHIEGSVLLWTHVAFVVAGFASLAVILTVAKDVCWAAATAKRQKKMPDLKFYALSYLACNRVTNFFLFNDPTKSKVSRLGTTMFILGCYSLASELFVPVQVRGMREKKSFFSYTEVQIGFITVIVNVIYLLGNYTFTSVARYNTKSATNLGNGTKVVGALIMSLYVLSGLTIVSIFFIGDSRLRQDIWAANVAICMGIEMLFMPVITFALQMTVTGMFKAAGVNIATSKTSDVFLNGAQQNLINQKNGVNTNGPQRWRTYQEVDQSARSPTSPGNSSPTRFTTNARPRFDLV